MSGQQSSLKVPVGGGHWARGRAPAICLALAAITFAVFGQTLHHQFVNYDDDKYVYDNPVVAEGLTLAGARWALTYGEIGHWHPLTWLSHMLDCQLYGLNPGGHHFTSVLLHTAAVVLLFLVLREMTGALWRSAFVAAVFAIHPLRVESVAWIAERKDVLSGVFFMLTLGAYVRYARQPSRGRCAAVAVLFGTGLLCKNTLVTLPFVLLLLDWWPLQRAGPGLVKEKIPLFLLSIGSCVATALVPEKLDESYRLPFLERTGNALVSYVIYLRQMVFPVNLASPYPYPPNGRPFWEIAATFVLLAAVSAVVLACRTKRPYLLVGWFWFLGMLVPMIGFVQISYYAHADRYTYLPGIGLAIASAWAAGDWSAGWKHRQMALGSLMAVVIGALMLCAWRQTGYWKNSETWWNHTLACTTNNSLAHYDLGNELGRQGRLPEAVAQYQMALSIKSSGGEIENNLGTALRQLGRVDEAIAHYQKAAALLPKNESVHFNLARCFLQKGGVAEAIAQYQSALAIQPADVESLNNLAWLLATSAQAPLRNGVKAVQLARRANELAGGKNPVILGTLAAACAEAGQFDEARRNVQTAIGLAQAAGRTELAQRLSKELQLYQASRPFHQP